VGSWVWIESSGGIAGVTLTPASTGETMAIDFTAGGEARLSRNGTIERTVDFDTSPGAEKGSLVVSYGEPLWGFDTQTATFPDSATLVLTDPCCDGFTYRYVRAL